MSIEEFINRNIKMLDNNTISVDHLANKFYIEICRDMGIPRTEKLENYIKTIFTQYKKGELNISKVNEFLSPVVGSETVTSGKSSSPTRPMQNPESTSEKPQEVEIPKDETTITETPKVEIPKDETTITETPKVEIPKEIKIDPQVENNLLKNIKMLDNNTISVDHLTNKLSVEIKNNYGLVLSDVSKEELSDVLSRYRRHELNTKDVVSYYGGLLNGGGYTKPTTTSYPKKKDPVYDEGIVDIDTDTIMDATTALQSVEEVVNSANITVPSGIAPHAGGMKEIVDDAKESVSENIEESKNVLYETLTANDEIDSGINKIDINLQDVYAMAYDKKQNSQLVEATADFFTKNGYQVDASGNVTINKNGKAYQYNINSHMLTINGTNKVGVKILVPRGATDYSKLNTYTCFASSLRPNDNSPQYDSMINGKESNAIVLQFLKWNGSKEYSLQNKGGDGSDSKFVKQYEVSEATKFINTVANTQIASGKCKNIVGGDSRFGAYSLMMAADYPDLYQTVYCINNAVILPKSEGGIGIRGSKTQFESLEQLRRLNGKEIYFISVANEPNFYHNNGWTPNNYNYSTGYTYTGLKQICENCPNAKITMIYNENEAQRNKNLPMALKNLEGEYSNYSYRPNLWYDFSNDSYYGHSEGQIMVSDVVKADATNANAFTAKKV